jgi:hypothetical protein
MHYRHEVSQLSEFDRRHHYEKAGSGEEPGIGQLGARWRSSRHETEAEHIAHPARERTRRRRSRLAEVAPHIPADMGFRTLRRHIHEEATSLALTAAERTEALLFDFK